MGDDELRFAIGGDDELLSCVEIVNEFRGMVELPSGNGFYDRLTLCSTKPESRADRVRRISKMLEKFQRRSVVERNSDVDERGVGFENLYAPTFRAPENVEDIRQRKRGSPRLGHLG
ncbi:MAG: hypothetical protein ACKOLA_10580 [Spartobacteria bacterium]